MMEEATRKEKNAWPQLQGQEKADLIEHIRQAHDDAQKIQITGEKISQQFQRIEAAELEEKPASNVVRLPEERKPGG